LYQLQNDTSDNEVNRSQATSLMTLAANLSSWFNNWQPLSGMTMLQRDMPRWIT